MTPSSYTFRDNPTKVLELIRNKSPLKKTPDCSVTTYNDGRFLQSSKLKNHMSKSRWTGRRERKRRGRGGRRRGGGGGREEGELLRKLPFKLLNGSVVN